MTGKIVFLSWYEGGNVVRSGVASGAGRGRFFISRPDTKPSRFTATANILRVIGNAVRWAAGTILPPRVTPQPEPPERVATENPLKDLDTKELHDRKQGR